MKFQWGKFFLGCLVIAGFGAWGLPLAGLHRAWGLEVGAAVSSERESTFQLTVRNQKISLEAKDAELQAILDALSRETGIPIHSQTRLIDTITMSFRELTFQEALKRIAGNWVLTIGERPDSTAQTITGVRILSRFRGPDRMPAGGALPAQGESAGSRISIRSPASAALKASAGLKPPREPYASAVSPKNEAAMVPGELILRSKPEVSRDQLLQVAAQIGATVKGEIPQLGYYVLSLPPRVSIQEGREWFSAQGLSDRLDPNFLIPLGSLPNDPFVAQQWPLSAGSSGDGSESGEIQVQQAWDVERGDPQVVIAVIDSGVEYTHEDLAPNVWRNPGEIPGNGIDDDHNGFVDDVVGWDFVQASEGFSGEDFQVPDNDPMDRLGHGTHVAGIIAAAADNGKGIAGVAWNCKIMVVRAGFMNASGEGALKSDDAARAIIYAVENGARIINLSWGNYQKSALIEDAVKLAVQRGVLVCAASGNDGLNAWQYPAAFRSEGVIAVGATDSRDRPAAFSNYGEWVDVFAPGDHIYSTYLQNSYYSMNGTSMAVAYVSGLAALLFSQAPDSAAQEVKARILRSADILEALEGKAVTSGRINALRALTESVATPQILYASPQILHSGDEVEIFGDGFGAFAAGSRVTFSPDRDAEIISWGANSIRCRVPAGAQTGELIVTTPLAGATPGYPVNIPVQAYVETLQPNGYSSAGAAQGWHADDATWEYQLPFAFPFFGRQYDRLYVCSNGYLDFSAGEALYENSFAQFIEKIMIAPFWADLTTDGQRVPGQDVYIGRPSADSISFRWVAEHYDSGKAVNVEVILYQDGRIQFNYGPENGAAAPTIGLSGGGSGLYAYSAYNGSYALNQAQSLLFTPAALTYEIPLALGFNLISLPLMPEDLTPAAVIPDGQAEITEVWGEEAGELRRYVPGHPELSDLTTLTPGRAYLINTTQAGARLSLTGRLHSTVPSLSSGMNLIGFASLQRESVERAVAPLTAGLEMLCTLKDGEWLCYDPQSPEKSPLREVEPGRGYALMVGAP